MKDYTGIPKPSPQEKGETPTKGGLRRTVEKWYSNEFYKTNFKIFFLKWMSRMKKRHAK